jgi:hypothetical protein
METRTSRSSLTDPLGVAPVYPEGAGPSRLGAPPDPVCERCGRRRPATGLCGCVQLAGTAEEEAPC